MLDYWPWFDKVIAKLPIAPFEVQRAILNCKDESDLKDRDTTCLVFTIFENHLYCFYEEDILDKGEWGSGIVIYSAEFKEVGSLSFNRPGWDLRWRALLKAFAP
jgi:hypothetical protein